MMRAAKRKEYCKPNGLKVEQTSKPTPKKNEVLVKVHASTVNRTDCSMLTGLPYVFRLFIGLRRPTRPITGTDFAGEVVEVGSQVSNFKVGDKVWGLNDEGMSSHAEYLCLKENGNIDIMPSNLSFEEGAACLEGPHYAFNSINKVNIQQGQSVLINGAAGGIGTALVQLLKIEGLNITVVCETKDIPMLLDLGASRAIDYTKDDVLAIDKKFNFIFDMIGNYAFKDWKPLLLKGGAFCSSELGPNNTYIPLVLTTMFSSKKVKFPLPLNIKRSMKTIKQHVEAGNYKPVIDRTYPLEEISNAFSYVEKGFKTGNVVIKMIN